MSAHTHTESCTVLGFELARTDLARASDIVLGLARGAGESTELVVTLNPELVVRAGADPELREALAGAALRVADGIGMVWAARRSGCSLPGRVAGVDLVAALLQKAGPELRVYFLGGRPGVAEAAAAAARAEFRSEIAGCHHGYFSPAEAAEVAARVRASGAQLLLCGLGEQQELFIVRHRGELGAAVAIGVGGSLDVMAGAVNRTPDWLRRLNLEWLWRVGSDPRRWHRIPRLLRFVDLVLRGAR